MSIKETVCQIVGEVLQVDVGSWNMDTLLLGAIPEFDSMAVVSVIAALEDNLGIFVEDDEISAETFETVGALVVFAESKI